MRTTRPRCMIASRSASSSASSRWCVRQQHRGARRPAARESTARHPAGSPGPTRRSARPGTTPRVDPARPAPGPAAVVPHRTVAAPRPVRGGPGPPFRGLPPTGRGAVSVPAHIRAVSVTVSSGGNPLSCNTIPTRGRTTRRSERVAAQHPHPPRRRGGQPFDHLQQGRLPGPVGAQQREQLTPANREAHPPNSFEPPSIAAVQTPNINHTSGFHDIQHRARVPPMSVHPSPVAVTTTPVTDDECHTRGPLTLAPKAITTPCCSGPAVRLSSRPDRPHPLAARSRWGDLTSTNFVANPRE